MKTLLHRDTIATQKSLIEIYLTANEPQALVDKYYCYTKSLCAEYNPGSLDEVIKACKISTKREKNK